MDLQIDNKLQENSSQYFIWTKQGQQIEVHHLQAEHNSLAGEVVFSTSQISVPSISSASSSNNNITEEAGSKHTSSECQFQHHKFISGDKPYDCGLCGKGFANKRNLLVHSRIHSGDRPYSCEVCGKAFTQKSLLTSHKRIHTGERPHHCGDCGKAFYQRDHLIKHIRIHSGEKPYSCAVCGKAFSDSSALRQHIKRHQETGPFVCNCCNEVFEKKYSYDLHMMAHKGLKPEECEVCGKQFPSKGLLTGHRRNHYMEKVYSCDMCDRQFARVVTLKKHLKYFHGFNPTGRINIPSDEKPKKSAENKPFKCNDCGLTFTNNGKFLVHQKTHLSNNQFKCDKCGMSFAKSYTLEVHQQMHSPDTLKNSVTQPQLVSQTVTIPVMTVPVMSAMAPNLEINTSTERRDIWSDYHSGTSLAINPNDNLGVVKILSLRPIDTECKTELHCDPLAMATAAAQLTTTDIVDGFAFLDQSSYTYYIPTQMTTTIPETELVAGQGKEKRLTL